MDTITTVFLSALLGIYLTGYVLLIAAAVGMPEFKKATAIHKTAFLIVLLAWPVFALTCWILSVWDRLQFSFRFSLKKTRK